jgi:glycosyltransferase involved in cell wall biosynthesis
LHAKVPFKNGGAEMLVEGLVGAINERLPNVRAELFSLPFKWYPEEQILSDMMAWRMLDFTESDGEPVDLVIGTKFPSYAVRHPNKVVWLVHQHRTFYDLEFGPYGKLVLSGRELAVRKRVRAADTELLKEARGLFSISDTVSDRLHKFNGLKSVPITPPSRYQNRIEAGEYGDAIVCIARIDRLKRQKLLVEGLARSRQARIKIIGTGEQLYLDEISQLVERHSLGSRCELLGFVGEDDLMQHLSSARAIFYAPFDEDYGYATVEGFQAKKPVITCGDSGEVARIVNATGSGWVVDPTPMRIGAILDRVAAMSPAELDARAAAGHDLSRSVSWDNVLNNLVIPYL